MDTESGLIIRLVLKFTGNREIRPGETAVKIQDNRVRFLFNKYNTGAHVNFELENLYADLEPKIMTRTFKGNYATFTFKKRQPERWLDLYIPGARYPTKSRYTRYNNFDGKQKQREGLQQFDSSTGRRQRNNRYMSADTRNHDKYSYWIPEEDCIMEEGDEGSENSYRKISHRMIPSAKDIRRTGEDILDRQEHQLDSFMANEQRVMKQYAKKPRQGRKSNAKGPRARDRNSKEPQARGKKARVIRAHRVDQKRGATSNGRPGFQNPYLQDSGDKREWTAHAKVGKAGLQRVHKAHRPSRRRGHKKTASLEVTSRYGSSREGRVKRSYRNSWLNDPESGGRRVQKQPKQVLKREFQKEKHESLMTIDEIIAREREEAEHNSKLRRATEIRRKKMEQAKRQSRSKRKSGAERPIRELKVEDFKLDYDQYRAKVKQGARPERKARKRASKRREPEEAPVATVISKREKLNRLMELQRREEEAARKQEEDNTRHREKSVHELNALKKARKSVRTLETMGTTSIHNESPDKELERDDFDMGKLKKLRFEAGPNLNIFGHAPRTRPENKMASFRSETHNRVSKKARFQTKSNIDLSQTEPSRKRPTSQGKHLVDSKSTKKVFRSRSSARRGLHASLNQAPRGMSQNLSNLAARTVVSYDGPNVSIVSLKLREKRGQILDTFAQLNLDMAWVHRQCRYIDLHSTQGVLKFFELQNRLIVKLATKLRKEKNARYKVERQCDKMMDNFKRGMAD